MVCGSKDEDVWEAKIRLVVAYRDASTMGPEDPVWPEFDPVRRAA